MLGTSFIFRQLFDKESSTYTYLIACPKTREAALIDPVRENVDRDLQLVQDLGLKLTHLLETHVHADHITGAGSLRDKTGAKTVVSALSGVSGADILVQDQERLSVGQLTIIAITTPGHTNSCMSYFLKDRVFTGDTLLIRGTGRTDFQEGSSEKLFQSVRKKLFNLPPETFVFPAHDYKGMTCSTIEEEMRLNPRLGMNKTLPEFVEIMNNLKLSMPAKIHEAVPANLKCGKVS